MSSKFLMPLAADGLWKQPRKLRKSLKKLLEDSSAARVHQLRTRTRRMEAMVYALRLDFRKNERLLLKGIKPVRKKAGKVRDMDVLTGFASQPALNDEKECTVRLLEHLGGQRELHARKLEKVAAVQAPEIRRRLKRSARFLENALSPAKKTGKGREWPTEAAALALRLEAELRSWPALSRRNLHPFRLRVKELRYVLQMAKDTDSEFIATLGEVKDVIGEWHDWEELAGIAEELSQHTGCKLLKEIHATAQDKFEHALATTNRMRKSSLGTSTKGRRRRSSIQSFSRVAQPALVPVSALAA